MAEENNNKSAAPVAGTNNAPAGGRPPFRRDGNRPEGRSGGRPPRRDFNREVEVKVWVPKTALGKDVLAKKYANLDEVLSSGKKIIEPEITDFLEPALSQEFVNVGQAKGKFGGGKRKISKPTQKVTREGSLMSFAMISVTGNKNGIVGLGFGKARETVPSREKAVASSKKDIIMIRRGCGDWGCFCGTAHSIPFSVTGVSGSVTVKLMPAPKGTGLVVEAELKKMLELAGIKDVWSKTFGQTKNKNNLMRAGFEALKNLQKIKLMPSVAQGRGIMDGGKNE